MTTLQLIKGRWRLYWNVCPACNSDAPECDTCTICMDWHGRNRPMYPPPKEEKARWWSRFVLGGRAERSSP